MMHSVRQWLRDRSSVFDPWLHRTLAIFMSTGTDNKLANFWRVLCRDEELLPSLYNFTGLLACTVARKKCDEWGIEEITEEYPGRKRFSSD
mmetsp:Transcript_6854/g.41803  ORF Transcript_6854/g.41803 Transcript_6854/m.41803 type:complete len:91 (+) Transcript_6854:2057-2329(+)